MNITEISPCTSGRIIVCADEKYLILVMHQKTRWDPAIILTLKAPITTMSSILSSAENFQICLLDSECRPRSTLFVNIILTLVNNVRQLFAADDLSRRNFQMHFVSV